MTASGRSPHQDPPIRTCVHPQVHRQYQELHSRNLPSHGRFGHFWIRPYARLQDLDVLNEDGESISNMDTKPKFISGFIVR
jgi:hypothetical protein